MQDRKNEVTIDSLKSLRELLRQASPPLVQIKTIVELNNKISDPQITAIEVDLSEFEGVVNYDLLFNQLKHEKVKYITLRSHYNNAHTIPPQKLSDLLTNNNHLIELTIHDTPKRPSSLDVESAKAIATALTQNNTLRILDVETNCIQNQGAVLLLEAFATSPSLLALDISNNLITMNPGQNLPKEEDIFQCVIGLLREPIYVQPVGLIFGKIMVMKNSGFGRHITSEQCQSFQNALMREDYPAAQDPEGKKLVTPKLIVYKSDLVSSIRTKIERNDVDLIERNILTSGNQSHNKNFQGKAGKTTVKKKKTGGIDKRLERLDSSRKKPLQDHKSAEVAKKPEFDQGKNREQVDQQQLILVEETLKTLAEFSERVRQLRMVVQYFKSKGYSLHFRKMIAHLNSLAGSIQALENKEDDQAKLNVKIEDCRKKLEELETQVKNANTDQLFTDVIQAAKVEKVLIDHKEKILSPIRGRIKRLQDSFSKGDQLAFIENKLYFLEKADSVTFDVNKFNILSLLDVLLKGLEHSILSTEQPEGVPGQSVVKPHDKTGSPNERNISGAYLLDAEQKKLSLKEANKKNKQSNKKLWIGLLAIVVGFALASTGIGGLIVGAVALAVGAGFFSSGSVAAAAGLGVRS